MHKHRRTTAFASHQHTQTEHFREKRKRVLSDNDIDSMRPAAKALAELRCPRASNLSRTSSKHHRRRTKERKNQRPCQPTSKSSRTPEHHARTKEREKRKERPHQPTPPKAKERRKTKTALPTSAPHPHILRRQRKETRQKKPRVITPRRTSSPAIAFQPPCESKKRRSRKPPAELSFVSASLSFDARLQSCSVMASSCSAAPLLKAPLPSWATSSYGGGKSLLLASAALLLLPAPFLTSRPTPKTSP